METAEAAMVVVGAVVVAVAAIVPVVHQVSVRRATAAAFFFAFDCGSRTESLP